MSALLFPEPQGNAELIWGHLDSPTGVRDTIEPIEEPAMRGGDVGLFAAAAADWAMAQFVEVGER